MLYREVQSQGSGHEKKGCKSVTGEDKIQDDTSLSCLLLHKWRETWPVTYPSGLSLSFKEYSLFLHVVCITKFRLEHSEQKHILVTPQLWAGHGLIWLPQSFYLKARVRILSSKSELKGRIWHCQSYLSKEKWVWQRSDNKNHGWPWQTCLETLAGWLHQTRRAGRKFVSLWVWNTESGL